MTALRYRGAWASLAAADRAALLDRVVDTDTAAIRETTAAILARVRSAGDAALFALAKELDGVELRALEVPLSLCEAALDALDTDLRRAMLRAATNIERVHRAAMPVATETSPEPGIVVGRRPDPLNRVGVYAPGGRAAYPSSVLMGAIPARVAGVREVVLCSPPGPNGVPSSVVLAAAAMAGVDRVFALGGAGAIGALAYGTASVPRVDRIVGPGNAFVAEAKRQVTDRVGIDSPAGPTELVVIADGTAHSTIVAREMVAQAEHDPRACVVAIVLDVATATDVERALNRLIEEQQPRRAIIESALAANGGVIVAADVDEAIAIANAYAPEHLLLAVANAEAVLPRLRNAGTIFVGETASVSFGDYMTGANHVLPTGGAARFYSGLSVLDFIRWTTYQRVDRSAAAALANDVSVFATAEALPGHAATARAWCEPAEAALIS